MGNNQLISMKCILVLMSVALLLPTTGCIFPGHRDHWEEREDHGHGDHHDYEEHREHGELRGPGALGVDVAAERLEALGGVA